MIGTSQWQASIGAFNISTKRSVSYADNKTGCECLEFIEYEVSCTCHYFPIVWFLSVYYVLNVFFQMLLLICGDIESNLGPVKTCPSCNAQIHIRKKVCVCGYLFNRNLKTLSPFPTCASPSKSYTDTLNSDTALNSSCGTHTRKSKEDENTESEGETNRSDDESANIDLHVDKGSLSQPSNDLHVA